MSAPNTSSKDKSKETKPPSVPPVTSPKSNRSPGNPTESWPPKKSTSTREYYEESPLPGWHSEAHDIQSLPDEDPDDNASKLRFDISPGSRDDEDWDAARGRTSQKPKKSSPTPSDELLSSTELDDFVAESNADRRAREREEESRAYEREMAAETKRRAEVFREAQRRAEEEEKPKKKE